MGASIITSREDFIMPLHPADIKDFPSLLEYLHVVLDWPFYEENWEDNAFDETPEGLGIDPRHAVVIKSLRQLRPSEDSGPWGIFYLEFEAKRLPVVVLRRILRALVPKKRQSANAAERRVWQQNDLLFICAGGETSHRAMTFAHFRAINDHHVAQLRTFGWDEREQSFYSLQNLNLKRLKWEHQNDWAAAFTAEHGRTIKDSRELAFALAHFARRTKDLALELLKLEKHDGKLHLLHRAFQKSLLADLDEAHFADTIAQTIAYGLFAGRATGHKLSSLALADLSGMIPETNPFLRDLFREFAAVSVDADSHQVDFDDLGVVDLVEFLNVVPMENVLADFGKLSGGGAQDPVIHFYETFLKEYDARARIQRGVYYTPKPVVDFIVRGVDSLLRSELDCPLGLADSSKDPDGNYRVCILDPATGTGTFLVSVIETIYQTMCDEWKKAGLRPHEYSCAWDEYVSRDLLPRLHGFELMMASYTVAHLKIGLKLTQLGYKPKVGERLRVFLTNTLEESQQLALDLPGFLSHEASEAQVVKNDTKITVIVGNPPYSSSMTENPWIMGLISEFKKNLGEQKADLNREEWKFMRLATHYSAQTSNFVTGWIINNAFLKAITHRLLREHLLGHGQQFYVLNLHGSSKPPEHVPLPVQAALNITKKEVNVFDIQQGVTVFASVKKMTDDNVSVKYGDLWGERERKYNLLSKESFDSLITEVLSPKTPQFFLVPKNSDNDKEYESGWSIADAFCNNISGIQSGRDHFVSTLTESEIKQRIKSVVQKESWEHIAPGVERPSWTGFSLDEYREAVKGNKPHSSQWLSTPFDVRPLLFHTSVIKRTRGALMAQMLSPNFGLCSVRQLSTPSWRHAFVSTNLISDTAISQNSREYNYLFPLYLYNPPMNYDTQLLGVGENGRRANLAPAFVAQLGAGLGLTWQSDGRGDMSTRFGPEDVLSYIYAIFHAPSYRSRYGEFLKIDFPRVPLTNDEKLFWKLVEQGHALIGLHLLETPSPALPLREGKGAAPEVPQGEVAAGYPKFVDGRVLINAAAGFDDVSPDVWDFHIGGYQVAHKWLKDRKGRALSPDDAAHYRRVLRALEHTIARMASIDEIIIEHGGWPLAGSQATSALSPQDVKSFFGPGGETPSASNPAKQQAPLLPPTRAPRQPQTPRAATPPTSTPPTPTPIAVAPSAAPTFTPSIADFSRDELIAALLAATEKRMWHEREDVLNVAARNLGFARVGKNIRAAFKSALNGAIRRGLLEYEGSQVRRARR